jgi:hypothetical protein
MDLVLRYLHRMQPGVMVIALQPLSLLSLLLYYYINLLILKVFRKHYNLKLEGHLLQLIS